MFITLTNIKNKNGNCHAFWQLPDLSDNLRTIPDSVFEKHFLLKKNYQNYYLSSTQSIFFFNFLFCFCFIFVVFYVLKTEIQIKALILVFEFTLQFFSKRTQCLGSVCKTMAKPFQFWRMNKKRQQWNWNGTENRVSDNMKKKILNRGLNFVFWQKKMFFMFFSMIALALKKSSNKNF